MRMGWKYKTILNSIALGKVVVLDQYSYCGQYSLHSYVYILCDKTMQFSHFPLNLSYLGNNKHAIAAESQINEFETGMPYGYIYIYAYYDVSYV